jgi:hypothetical protein
LKNNEKSGRRNYGSSPSGVDPYRRSPQTSNTFPVILCEALKKYCKTLLKNKRNIVRRKNWRLGFFGEIMKKRNCRRKKEEIKISIVNFLKCL